MRIGVAVDEAVPGVIKVQIVVGVNMNLMTSKVEGGEDVA
jgi:hypothetical protein